MTTPNHLITLRQIRDARPCGLRTPRGGEPTGFAKLLRGLGEPRVRHNRDRQITIGDVAVINGVNDALWCLRCLDDNRVIVRAIWPAVLRAVRHTTDRRVHEGCIAPLQRWLDGDDTVDLRAAAEAAWDAAAAGSPAAWAAVARAEEIGRQRQDLIDLFGTTIEVTL